MGCGNSVGADRPERRDRLTHRLHPLKMKRGEAEMRLRGGGRGGAEGAVELGHGAFRMELDIVFARHRCRLPQLVLAGWESATPWANTPH